MGRLFGRNRNVTCRPTRQCQYRATRQYYYVPQSTASSSKAVKEIKKPVDLDFNGLKLHENDPNSGLAKWLTERRKTAEVNNYKAGDTHFLEIKTADSIKIQFFDKANKEWKAVPDILLGKFYQAKEKILRQEKMEEEKMTVIGTPASSADTRQKTNNDTKAEAGIKSESDVVSSSEAKAISTSSPALTIVNNNGPTKGSKEPSAGIDVFEKTGADGSTQRSAKIGAGGGFIQITGDVTLFGNNNHGRQSSQGSSTLMNGSTVKDSAIGRDSSTNGMSGKEKKALKKELKKIYRASMKAAESADEAKQAANQAVKASRKSQASSEEAVVSSKATQKATQHTKNTVMSAVEQINEKLDQARKQLRTDGSKAAKEQLEFIQKSAEDFLTELDKKVPELAKEIAPLIQIEVPKAEVEVPELKLNLNIHHSGAVDAEEAKPALDEEPAVEVMDSTSVWTASYAQMLA